MTAFFISLALILLFIPFVLPVILFIKHESLKKEFLEYKLKTNRVINSLNDSLYNNQEIQPEEIIKKEPDLKVQATFKEEKVSKKTNNNFENIFLGNIFNKIGAIVLVFAIGIFVKLISPFITPLVQISIALMISCGFVIGSLYLHKKDMKNYAQVLCGIGIAGALISIYTGCSFYEVMPIPLAGTLGFSVVVLSYYIAQKFNTFSTLLIGLLGGYLNPFLINHCVDTGFLFSYLILVNLITIPYVNKNASKIFLNFLNLFATLLTITIFSIDKEIIIIYPLILWAVYFFNDIYIIFKDKHQDGFKILSWLNFIVLSVLTINVFKIDNLLPIGYTLIGSAVMYLIAQFFINKFKKDNKVQLQNAILAVLFSTYFLSNEILRPCLWAFEGLILGYLYKKTNCNELKNYPLTFVFVSVASVFLAKNALYKGDELNLFINPRLVLFGLPSLFICLLSFVTDKKDIIQVYAYRLISLTFIYLYLIFEVSYSSFAQAIKCYTYAVLAGVYSINTKRASIVSKSSLFLTASCVSFVCGLILFIIAIASTTVAEYQTYSLIFNMHFLTAVVLIVASICLANNIFKYIAIILGAVLIWGEASILCANEIIVNEPVVYSIALIFYSGIIMLFGIFKNIKLFKMSGIWLSLFLIVKILFFDLSDIEPVLKLIVFAALGGCLMLVSYYYSKSKK